MQEGENHRKDSIFSHGSLRTMSSMGSIPGPTKETQFTRRNGLKAKITNQNVTDLVAQANELSMELILTHNKIRRGECEQINQSADAIRVVNNLAMWSAQFSILLVDKLEEKMNTSNAHTPE